jgi:hypothetical protein
MHILFGIGVSHEFVGTVYFGTDAKGSALLDVVHVYPL